MSGRRVSDDRIGHHYLSMPSVGVVYEINTEGLNLRQPHLTKFKNHQSNVGDEYISDVDIPHSKVNIHSLHVSADFLHDSQDIPVSLSAKSDIRKILDKRQEHLEMASYDISKIENKTSLMQMSFSRYSPECAVMRKLYGDEELAFKKPADLPTGTNDEIRDYLLCKSYNEDGLNFTSMNKIFSSDKLLNEFKESMNTPAKPTVQLDPALEIGLEIELQKRINNTDFETNY
jgi:hypothetical protein